MKQFMKINSLDNVGVAISPIPAGTTIILKKDADRRAAASPGSADNQSVTALEEIPAGHKMALADIPENGEITKYGHCIGRACENIKAGSWVHVHNIRTTLDGPLEYDYQPVQDLLEDGYQPVQDLPVPQTEIPAPNTSAEGATFMGFIRNNGKTGIRNDIWIIPTVGCVNKIAEAIARTANDWLGAVRDRYEMVGNVIAFSHPYGCSQMDDDQENTRTILADLINHPNAGGVLVLGLGCENSNIDTLKPYLGKYDEHRVKFLIAQEHDDEITDAVNLIKELADHAAHFKRQPLPVNRLIVGLKCGGSDGLSGITANPLVGKFSDLLISEGGTTILTEVPEMFGAESILMSRCANEKLFHKTVKLINDFKEYYRDNGQPVYDNPSPGNKAGGISTLEEKSLGCVQKSGNAPIRGVLSYGECVRTPGLNLLSAPGNDLVASTALAAAGAHIILFTTGRGTPFASPVPTLKIASNSSLARKKSNWIDFDAGTLLEDGDIDGEAQKLFDLVLKAADGQKTRSEEAGLHDMAIFKQGVTL